ncbi:unnamed protein product [Trifolium pratense]|uniref:Uncharacterized protein n=1 Tax=Trifolium pratense TaxID=57577 RepID=A0ACB0IKX1_TRIPR|nr:unnamed protein product [Trifolium pratense]
MDERELNLEHVGICYKLYNFIMKTLVAQTLKTVTLGTSSNSSRSSTGGVPTSTKADKMVRLVTPCGGVNSNELQTNQSFFNGGNCLSPQTEHVEEKNNLLFRNVVDEYLHHQASKKMVTIDDETISF